MTVYAVVPIRHGLADGSIQNIEVGEKLTEGDLFDEVAIRNLIAGGSAVEVGKSRKYSEADESGTGDAATLKRDELIKASLSGDETSDESTATATP